MTTLELCKELLAQATRDYGQDAPVTKRLQDQVKEAEEDERKPGIKAAILAGTEKEVVIVGKERPLRPRR